MATTPKSRLGVDEKGSYVCEDKDYPGYTVDLLLEQGKIEEARKEFERLAREGLNSGPGIQVTPQFWDDLRAEIHKRAAERR